MTNTEQLAELRATAEATRELAGEYPTAAAREHDERMRMAAWAIGARMAEWHLAQSNVYTPHAQDRKSDTSWWAAWAYREATGREWGRGE